MRAFHLEHVYFSIISRQATDLQLFYNFLFLWKPGPHKR